MKIKVKIYERVPDSVIRKCSLLGLIIPNMEWVEGIPYKVTYW